MGNDAKIDYIVGPRIIPGIITVTTDFGLQDHYVGVMKGVIAGINPDVRLIDISHDVRSYEVAHGAFVIAQAYRYFPAGTVHLVVVDPGVGSERRAIVAAAAGQFFVAPDNGVLSQVFEREEHTVRVIDVDRFALKPTSRTFHGRDVFAPVAGRLSLGTPFEDFGEVTGDYVRLEPTTPKLIEPGHWRGRVLNIDRFGNIVTSFPSELLERSPVGFRIELGEIEVATVAESYAAAPEGTPFIIAGSSGYLEVSINQGSAGEQAGVGLSSVLDLRFDEEGP